MTPFKDPTAYHIDMPPRPRRNRKSPTIRHLVCETSLSTDKLIYPLFVHDKKTDTPIDAMPGCKRWSIKGLCKEVGRILDLGIGSVVLFPDIDPSLKCPRGDEAVNDQGLIPRAIRKLKKEYPHLIVITDVALDPYNSDGHDGLVGQDGRILNDKTLVQLIAQALGHAEAGADIVAPSDMMDGRVGAIRAALDIEGFTDVSIMSYAVKYASAFYGPFRDALHSAPNTQSDKPIPGDKKTYQMDPANVREAIREIKLDEAEGADILIVKPAGPYLDIIKTVRENTTLPIAAYQVSGEYTMIQLACDAGYLDLQSVAMESLLGIRRAGADMILTYFAPLAASWLKEG